MLKSLTLDCFEDLKVLCFFILTLETSDSGLHNLIGMIQTFTSNKVVSFINNTLLLKYL